MESRSTYRRAMENPNPTEEEKRQVLEFQEYLKLKREQNDYAPPISNEIERDYRHEMEYLKSLQEMNPNTHYEEILKKDQEILNKPSKLEMRNIQMQKEEELSLKRTLSREKKAGFTNASILIFVVLNLGLFLATLLLLYK